MERELMIPSMQDDTEPHEIMEDQLKAQRGDDKEGEVSGGGLKGAGA